MEEHVGVTRRAGAYGLRVEGLGPTGLAVAAPDSWPPVSVVQRVQPPHRRPYRLHAGGAEVPLIGDSSLEVEREPLRATFCVPTPLDDDELLHPYFAAPAAWFGHWLGRDSFHAGCIGAGGRAYGIVGNKEAGKSSLLAWFAGRGFEVVSDDMVVVAAETVFTGPRCIDLRPQTVAALQETPVAAPVRGGSRQRVLLPDAPHEWPLGGWVFLSWGPRVELRAVPPRDRLARLAPHRVLHVLPHDPAALLPLAALPAWELTRPRRWDAMDDVLDAVSAVLGR